MRRPIRAALAIAAAAAIGSVTAAVASAGASGASAAPAASADVLMPPADDVYTGVSSGSANAFATQVGKHAAVYGEFVNWGQSIHFAFETAAADHAQLMLHISPSLGPGARQAITPDGVAQGQGDAYLLTLSKLIASYGRAVYIRLWPEMNNASNPFSAYNADGSSRGPAFAPTEFNAAWRRVVIVLRGGAVSAIDAQLAALGLPRLHGIGSGGSVAQSRIAFVWCPETAGTPPIAGNAPANYDPGDAYVDWVSTDFYSRFPNFTGLNAFYKQYPHKPFAFSEWALWGGDDPGFVEQLFAWVNSHHRVRMMLYNQGYAVIPFGLSADPASTAAIRQQLAAPRFLAYTVGWQ